MTKTRGEASSRVMAGLGDRIRRYRVARGLDQAKLAAQAEIGIESLARMERGEETPSLEVLAQLAAALEVGLAELFADGKASRSVTVVRREDVQTVDVNGMDFQVLTPRAVVSGLYAARLVVPPSRPEVQAIRYEGHDWMYVVRGRLRIELDQEETTLRAGDSISFSARIPHRLAAEGNKPAEVLAVGATLPVQPPL